MAKKPITRFLKVMSIIILILSAFGILFYGFVIFLAPQVEEAIGEPIGFMSWLSLIVCAICMLINFFLAIMALQHKKVDRVYRISLMTLMFTVVFSSVEAGGIRGYLMALANAVIPALFCWSAYKQNKVDEEIYEME